MSDVVLHEDVAIGYTPYLMGVMEKKMEVIANCEMAMGGEIQKGIHHFAVSFFAEVIILLEKNLFQPDDIVYSRTFPILRRVMARILGVNEILMEDSAMLPWLRTARTIVAKANTPCTFEVEEIQVLQTLPSFFHDLDVYGQKDLTSRHYASMETDDDDD